jgi:hypothetical protein
MKSQINMKWNKMPHHHTTFFLKTFADHGIMNPIFLMACRDKITCYEFFVICFPIFSKKTFDVIRHDVHVCTLHLYKIILMHGFIKI